MTNEEILANAPKDGAATHVLVDHEHHVTYAKRYHDSGNWFWFHPDSGWLEFDRMPTAQNIQSLFDIRRIVELEKANSKLNREKSELWRRICKAQNYLSQDQDDSAYNAMCVLDGEE